MSFIDAADPYLGWLNPALLAAKRGAFPNISAPSTFSDPMSGLVLPGADIPPEMLKPKSVFDTGAPPVPFGSLSPSAPMAAPAIPEAPPVIPNAFPGATPGAIGGSPSAPMTGPGSPSTFIPTNTAALSPAPGLPPEPLGPAPREDSANLWQGPPMLPGMGAAMQAPKSAVPGGSLLDRIGNGIHNNADLLLALGAGFAGAPSFGEGMHRAFTNAGPMMGRNQTIQALMARGLPQDVAQAAASNPAIMQQLIPSLFGPKQLKFAQIGEDMMGNKRFGFVDEVGGQAYDMSGKPIGASSTGAMDVPMGANGLPMHGQELLNHLERTDPAVAAGVKGILNGNMNAASRNLQKLLPIAGMVEPGFTQQDYATRLGARKDFTSGSSAKELTAYDTMARHADKLHKLVDEMDPNSVTNFLPALTNPTRNFMLSQFSPEFQRQMGQFENLAGGLAAERAKALKGGNVAEGDINEGRAILSKAKSKAALHGAIDEMFDMVNARIAAKEDAYKRAMGSAANVQEFMSPEAARLYKKYLGEGNATPAALGPVASGGPGAMPAQAAPAMVPAPGKYVYDPATGALKLSQ